MQELQRQLKVTLATVFSFYLKTAGFHWNVEGPAFFQLHKMFEAIYQDTYQSIDGFAENIRALNTYSPGSLARMSELSLVEDCSDILSAGEMIKMLEQDNEIVIQQLDAAVVLATKYNKQGLINFLTARIETHTKWGWFLKSSRKD